MTRYLLIDVGAGTMDVLWQDDAKATGCKAVVTSPVRHLAAAVRATSGGLLVTGGEMGGGPISRALVERAQDHRVVITAEAAATIHHDVDRVRAQGLEVVDEVSPEVEDDHQLGRLHLADIDLDRLRRLLECFGVEGAPEVIGCCCQDHGVPPRGVSHLDHRHRLFAAALDGEADLSRLLYSSTQVPQTFNRLRRVAADASKLAPGAEVFVMDSGLAAIVGARLDPRARRARCALVLDVATSHTVGAAYDGEELCALFEYHTKDLTVDRLDELLLRLAEGELTHEEVLAEGGHGAWVRRAVGFEQVEAIVATGPRRALLEGSRHPIEPGAPLGDNMMTGTAGLLELIRRRRTD